MPYRSEDLETANDILDQIATDRLTQNERNELFRGAFNDYDKSFAKDREFKTLLKKALDPERGNFPPPKIQRIIAQDIPDAFFTMLGLDQYRMGEDWIENVSGPLSLSAVKAAHKGVKDVQRKKKLLRFLKVLKGLGKRGFPIVK